MPVKYTAYLLLTILVAGSACTQVKDTGRQIGHTTRDVTREIGHATRNTVKKVGASVKEATSSDTK